MQIIQLTLEKGSSKSKTKEPDVSIVLDRADLDDPDAIGLLTFGDARAIVELHGTRTAILPLVQASDVRMYAEVLRFSPYETHVLFQLYHSGRTAWLRHGTAMSADVQPTVSKQALKLSEGLCVCVAPTGYGKTTLLREWAAQLNCPIIAYGERSTGELTFDDDFSVMVALCTAIEAVLDDQAGAVIIDSLRYHIYSGRGSTGKGGVDLTYITTLSGLNNFIAELGVVLIVALNPLAPDIQSYNFLADNVESSAAMTLVWDAVVGELNQIVPPSTGSSRGIKFTNRATDEYVNVTHAHYANDQVMNQSEQTDLVTEQVAVSIHKLAGAQAPHSVFKYTEEQ